jgi:Tol biopolymer transport system component/DNA-binding winged helix-turn-helix (wHTH) protein
VTDPEEKQVIRFGTFEVDPRTGELRKNGLQVKLQDQPFQVLLALLVKPGEVVTREELRAKLWPADTFVDFDHGLNAAVKRLREALDDSAENPRFVETLPRRGYRFIAPVEGGGEKSAVVQPISPELNTAGVESAPRIRKHWRVAAIAAGLTFCAALGFGIWLVLPTPQPRVLRSTQLTNDGKDKCCLVTDGSRIYFTGDAPIEYVPVTGGDAISVPTPWGHSFSWDFIVDLSPDHDKLLFTLAKSPYACSLGIVPVTGSAPRLLTNLREAGCNGASWSPNGRTLVYSSGSDLFLARSDGTEPRKLAIAKGTVSRPVWSPDGKFVRFVVSEEKPVARSTFFEVSAEGGDPHEVTPHWKDKAFEYFGRWTPDGKYFLFLSGRNDRLDIWAIREHPSFPWLRKCEPIQLTAGPVRYWSLAFSPDGKKIFTRGVELRGELQRYDSNSGRFQPFLQGISADCCAYSKDTQWVVYVTYPEGGLWRSKSDGSQRQQLTWPPMRVLNPYWSPDGTEIAFSALIAGKTWKTFIIPAEGGEPRQLTQNDCSELDAHWSPDGTHMIFAPFAPEVNFVPSTSCPIVIYTMDLRTREISTVPGSEGLWSPRWSPDGKRIVALNRKMSALMIYDIPSGKWSELARPTPGAGYLAFGFPQWSRDGKLVYYVTGGSVEAAACSIRIDDKKVEKLADLSGVSSTVWHSVDPDGNPLIDRNVSLNEIYALDLEAP